MKIILCAGILTPEIHKLIKKHVEHMEQVIELASVSLVPKTLLDHEAIDQVFIFSSALKDETSYQWYAQCEAIAATTHVVLLEKDAQLEIPEKLWAINHRIEHISQESIKALFQEEVIEKKESFFRKMFGSKEKKVAVEPQQPEMATSSIQKGVYCVIGHGGIGKTNFIANMAYILSVQSVRTVIVDLKVLTRDINLYYSQLTHYTDGQINKKASLLKCLEDPTVVEESVLQVNGYLDIIGTSLDLELSEEEIALGRDIAKIGTFIQYLRQSYDIVFIEGLTEEMDFVGQLNQWIDRYILTWTNSAYSIIKTAKQLTYYFERYPKMYSSMKYKTSGLLYRFSDKNQFEKVKLTEKKTLQMLQNMLEGYTIEFSKITVMTPFKEVDMRLYSDMAVDVYTPAHYNYFYERCMPLFKAYE